MSVVSSEVSKDNPVKPSEVQATAAKLGFKVDESEIDALHVLLAASYDTFEELSRLEDWQPEPNREQYPRQNIEPGTEVDGLGFPWSYRFTIEDKKVSINNYSETTSGLLSGRNVVVKDNICVADIPQLNGMDATQAWTPQMDATVVDRILKAGGRIVGTATCEALSCATVSNTAAVGPVFNPWAKGYSAGGSSSGVAALVGCQRVTEGSTHSVQVDMGLGADQGGSIRVPAAFCGLVGLKATYGLIPYTGVISCEPVLDHVGPLCKTVWDTALVLEAVAGRDELDDRQTGAHAFGEISYSTNLRAWYNEASKVSGSKPLSGLTIAILEEALNAPFVKEEMKREVQKVAEQFEQLGATVNRLSFPDHALGRSLWMGVCRQSLTSIALGKPQGRRCYYPTGFQQTQLPWTQDKWDRLPPSMRNEFINGVFEADNYPTLYQKCMNLTLKLTKDYERQFRTHHAMLLPSVPFTAPPLFNRGTASTMEKISATFGQTLNTMQFNLTGHPAMVIPTGLACDMSNASENLLPLSVQLVGPLWGEETLLKFGFAYEKAFDWKSRIVK